MSNKRLTPPIKYHGGKWYLAPKIIELMPKHLTYAEPFYGGGSVLLAKDPEGISEIVNDINNDLINFWNVLRSEAAFAVFKRFVEATPFGEPVYFHHKYRNMNAISDVFGASIMAAVSFFVTARQSLAGRGDAPAPISVNRVRRGMNEQVSAWLTAIDGLPAVHERMKRVVLFREGFTTFIEGIDNEKTLFYCDPPYVHATRKSAKAYGEYEMEDHRHQELLDALAVIKGKFILSGYDNDMYRDAAKKNKWRSVKFDLPNNSAGGKAKRRMTEVCWMNY